MKRFITLLSVALLVPTIQAAMVTEIVNKGNKKATASLNVPDHAGGFYEVDREYEGDIQPGAKKLVKLSVPTNGSLAINTGSKEINIHQKQDGSIVTSDSSKPNAAPWYQSKIADKNKIVVTINPDGGISLR